MRKLLSKLKQTVRSFKFSKHGPARSAATRDKPQVDHVQPKAKVVQIDPRLNAPLENLPPEVRRQILFALDLDCLKTLTHASPVYHQQFLLDRKPLLRDCLENTLRSVAIDAHAVYLSSSASFSNSRTKDSVAQFLQSYQDRRRGPKHSFLAELSIDEAMSVVSFHTSIIQPLAQKYTLWALDNFAKMTGSAHIHEPLSRTEETRLLRALYRFQLCANLFGTQPDQQYVNGHLLYDYDSRLEPMDILCLFAGLYEPWEVEEMVCICRFAKDKYNQIFDAICWDVDENNPKFDGQRPPTPEGAFNLSEGSFQRDNLLTAMLSRGLNLLHTVFFRIRDHEHLVSTMQYQLCGPQRPFLDDEYFEALDEGTQYMRRRQYPSEQDEKQDRRDPFPFEGDCVALVGADGVWTSLPPLAWTVLWGETYSNIFGWCVEKTIQRSGWVLWDARRIEETGAKEALIRCQEQRWGDYDPRNSM